VNWTALLDPANGGPGEPPGYRETLAAIRLNPYAGKRQRAVDKSSIPCANVSKTPKHGAPWPRPPRLKSKQNAASL
jgi:hypothetical protein